MHQTHSKLYYYDISKIPSLYIMYGVYAINRLKHAYGIQDKKKVMIIQLILMCAEVE